MGMVLLKCYAKPVVSSKLNEDSMPLYVVPFLVKQQKKTPNNQPPKPQNKSPETSVAMWERLFHVIPLFWTLKLLGIYLCYSGV